MPEPSRLAPEATVSLHLLQCLDDAIAFRSARLARPCPVCAPGTRCTDHARDENLIASYQHGHARGFREFLARFDAATVRHIMAGSDGIPLTALATAIALHARMTELAADGPFITALDGDPVIIEADGSRLLEHLLEPGGSGPGTGAA